EDRARRIRRHVSAGRQGRGQGPQRAPVLQMGRRRAPGRDATLELSQIPDRARRPYRRRVPDRGRADGCAGHRCGRERARSRRITAFSPCPPAPARGAGAGRGCVDKLSYQRPITRVPTSSRSMHVQKGRIRMSVQTKLPSDIEGLAKMVPPVSRRGFMTSSAAAAAGYTLLAGPVRADAIKTDTNGLTVGDAKVKVAGGHMPVFFAKPPNVANPPVILVAMEIFGVHEYIRDVTRRLAHLGALAIAPDYYFRAGVDLTKIDDLPH